MCASDSARPARSRTSAGAATRSASCPRPDRHDPRAGAAHGRDRAVRRRRRHEIKNPLSSLKSATEILPKIEDDERRDTLLRIATEDLRRIDRLITDISDASRLDAELNRATAGPVDIGGLLESLATVLAATWGEDGPHLELGPDLDRGRSAGRFTVDGVEDRLVQVMRNLLDNARSFSPAGGTVTIGCRRQGRWIEVTVSDRGPGIPAGREEAIFTRFYSDRPEGEKFGTHSGLGLSISRQIVEAHGGAVGAGNLGADPDRPEGARFVVRLPAARRHEARIAGRRESGCESSFDRRQNGLRATIASFRRRGLKAFYEGRTIRRVAPAYVERSRDILAALDLSRGPEGMNLPGFRPHEPKGRYAVSASGDWRVTFRFEDNVAVDADCVDYRREGRTWGCITRRVRAAS